MHDGVNQVKFWNNVLVSTLLDGDILIWACESPLTHKWENSENSKALVRDCLGMWEQRYEADQYNLGMWEQCLEHINTREVRQLLERPNLRLKKSNIDLFDLNTWSYNIFSKHIPHMYKTCTWSIRYSSE